MNRNFRSKNFSLNLFFFKKVLIVVGLFLLNLAQAQEYPFSLPQDLTATLNVNTHQRELFRNTLLGYNIQGFDSKLQKDFIRLVDPITIRFPHGVWANFYKWQTDGYQNDSFDNKEHEFALNGQFTKAKGNIKDIAFLNKERLKSGAKAFDMMWTYSVNFDNAASCVARAKKDKRLGLEVKDIELGNEHFWETQRANRTATEADYLREASAIATALKNEFPDIRISIPLGWRRTQADYNKKIIGDANYFDAITVHKYIGADPDKPEESNSAYSTLLTAKLELENDVKWIRDNFALGKPVWLTEWGVSGGKTVKAAACLGMADVYLYMAENQQIFERSNWFSFNRVLNAMVVVGKDREPMYPLQKRGYLSTYQIIRSVFKDATILKTNLITSGKLSTNLGAVAIVNGAVVTKEGKTTAILVNLANKPVDFVLQFDNVVYEDTFKHESLIFKSVGEVDPVDFYSNPLKLVKNGKGKITLPPLSISTISDLKIILK